MRGTHYREGGVLVWSCGHIVGRYYELLVWDGDNARGYTIERRAKGRGVRLVMRS
jgi:hypothetical protein